MKQKENDLYNIKNLKIIDYKHGGSRIFFEDEKGNKQLICDTYGNKDNIIHMRIKYYIHNVIAKCCIMDKIKGRWNNEIQTKTTTKK